MGCVACVQGRGVFPRTTTEVRQGPEVACGRIKGPETAAVRVAEGGRGFFTGQVDAIYQTAICSERLRFMQRGGAQAVESAQVELAAVGDKVSRAVVDIADGQPGVLDAAACFVDVEVGDASATLCNDHAVCERIGVSGGAGGG